MSVASQGQAAAKQESQLSAVVRPVPENAFSDLPMERGGWSGSLSEIRTNYIYVKLLSILEGGTKAPERVEEQNVEARPCSHR